MSVISSTMSIPANSSSWNRPTESLEIENGVPQQTSSFNFESVPLVGGNFRSSSTPLTRRALVVGLVVTLLLASFFTGRVSAPQSKIVYDCPEQENIHWDDASVAPEGPVSSKFEARNDYRGHPRSIEGEKGVVAADHGRCSDIGVSILDAGGNAVDAAIATALCQGIMNPMASGVGGGHFMLIRKPDGTAEVIDARETAPEAATEDMFAGTPQLSLLGGLAVAVPLELKGLFTAHERHGRLPWQDLVVPSISLASDGFPAHPYFVSVMSNKDILSSFQKDKLLRETFLIKQGNTWRPPKVNETCCKRPQLAKLLTDVALAGPTILYNGRYSKGLVEDIQAAGGIISLDDLELAAVEVKPALVTSAMGVELIFPPPPSSAATVASALMILDGYALPLAGAGALGVHREVECMKHAFALRMSLGDPLFVDVAPIIQDMLSSNFTEELRQGLRDDGVLDTTAYGGRWNVLKSGAHKDDHGTSHLSVVDTERMAVSMTTTINTAFGSQVISPSTGILLNNQMDDFSTPNQSNVYGVAPSMSNYIRPGKKPFSSMAPMIIQVNGELRYVVGGSGGPRIISAVLQTLLRTLSYGEDLFTAIAGARLHHQLLPDVLYTEDWNAGPISFVFDNSTALELAESFGHNVTATNWGAVVQGIEVTPGSSSKLHAVSDPRKDGAPAAQQ